MIPESIKVYCMLPSVLAVQVRKQPWWRELELAVVFCKIKLVWEVEAADEDPR